MGTFIHQLALCESKSVGDGTRIWAFAHVMDGAVVGTNCNIGEGVFVESGAILGDRVTLKNQALVWNGVEIGDDVFVGPGVIFTNDNAPRSPRMPQVRLRYESQQNWLRRTLVRRGASLGAGAIILPGLTIGEFAMVGGGAVVTRNVLPHQLVAGNPARPLGWVCVCGARLEDKVECRRCPARYRPMDGGLVLADQLCTKATQ